MTGQVPTLGTPLGGSTTQVAGLGAYLGQGLFQGSGSSRLGIISGQQISVKGRPTYEVDYRLNDRWSLVGEYDQFDEYNADVKWRVFRRGKDNGAP
jgi:translocation and assembly module TamB